MIALDCAAYLTAMMILPLSNEVTWWLLCLMGTASERCSQNNKTIALDESMYNARKVWAAQ